MSNPVKNFCLVLLVFLSTALLNPADAARLGGGKSFGGKPSYNMPYKRSTDAAPANPTPQHAAPATAPNAPTPAVPRSNGLMGMLGGLAMGGLLGAMLFGGGFHGINLLDGLLFAGVAFLAYKWLAGRRYMPQPAAGDQFSRVDLPPEMPPTRAGSNPAGFDTDVLSHKAGADFRAYPGAAAKPAVPADFDVQNFLDGASSAYRHLQIAWDQGELAEIRGLVTDKVFAEIQQQFRQRQGENRTELLKVDAELLEVRDRDNEREASVLFDVMLRETEEERPKQVREVWHFTRSKLSRQPTWFLDGIQQLED